MVRPGFQQQDAACRIFAQPRGDDGTSGSGTRHDVVIGLRTHRTFWGRAGLIGLRNAQPVGRKSEVRLTYSSSPSGPNSFPKPLALCPPNGAAGSRVHMFTPMVPVCTRRATESARTRSVLHTLPPRPNSESLAIATASSSL